MNDSKNNGEAPDDATEVPEAAAAAEEISAGEAPQTEGAPAEAESDPVAALKAENEELRDRLLRAVAEMENLRKRTEREVRDAAQYAITGFARDMLGVGDNMRRALEMVSEEARAAAEQPLKALLEGIEMTERDFINTLERHGVTPIDPAGERFDPHLHQAMFEVEDASVPAGTVVQVMQTGFTINGRVLRPAMVGVSKGGPKPGPAADGTPGSTVDRTA